MTLVSWNSYFNRDCLNEADAQSVFDQAIYLEKHVDLKEARGKYKIVDATACENYDVRGSAFEKAVAIQKILDDNKKYSNDETIKIQ